MFESFKKETEPNTDEQKRVDGINKEALAMPDDMGAVKLLYKELRSKPTAKANLDTLTIFLNRVESVIEEAEKSREK